MNSNEDPVDYCPYRANVGWGQVQTQDFSKVNYFQASDDELRNDDDVFANGQVYPAQPQASSSSKKKKKSKKDKKAAAAPPAPAIYDEAPTPPEYAAPETPQETVFADEEWAPITKAKKKKKKKGQKEE
ncbi:hypothetical protein N0V92_012268, partial [Colletotrichum tropicale]